MRRALLICVLVACLVAGGFIVWGAGGDFYVIAARHAALPKGSIIMWSGQVDASGRPIINGKSDMRWHVCDGTEGTPDLAGRFVRAASAPHWNAGQTGGAEQATLTSANLASHAHRVVGPTECTSHDHLAVVTAPTFSYAFLIGGSQPYASGEHSVNKYTRREGHIVAPIVASCDTPYGGMGGSIQGHLHGIDLDSAPVGEGVAVDIMPPYYDLVFLMYIGG